MQWFKCKNNVVIRNKPAKHGDPSFQNTPLYVFDIKDGVMHCTFYAPPPYTVPKEIEDVIIELDGNWQDNGWKRYSDKDTERIMKHCQ